jgi:hypothetical protein
MIIELNKKIIDTKHLLEIGEIKAIETGWVSFMFIVERISLPPIRININTDCFFTNNVMDNGPKDFQQFNDLIKLKKSKEYQKTLTSITEFRKRLIGYWKDQNQELTVTPVLNF